MPVGREIPQIVDSDFDESVFFAPPDDSEIEWPLKEFGEDRYDVELEHRSVRIDN